MGMMIHRNRKRKKEKQSAIVQAAETPEKYVEETPEEQRYTKTDINKMSKAELLEIAKNTGVEGADEMSRADLVEYLLSVFKL